MYYFISTLLFIEGAYGENATIVLYGREQNMCGTGLSNLECSTCHHSDLAAGSTRHTQGNPKPPTVSLTVSPTVSP